MHAPKQDRNPDEIVDDIMWGLGGSLGRSLILPKADTPTINRFIQQAVMQVPQADWEEAGNTVRVEVITRTGERVPREPSGGNPISPKNIVRAEITAFGARLTALKKRQKRIRKQRMAEAKFAQSLDNQLAKAESMLKHPLASWSGAGFISGIKGKRKALQLQIQSRPKGGQQTDHLKLACAQSAFYLMQKFSHRKPSYTPASPYQIVTMLLYELATGEPHASVRRACDAVLRSPPITRAQGKAAMDGAASVTFTHRRH
jgi:hypothetical protein